ncbi:hypothetical protein EV44_g4739 [Erysiphe necator]|uniref:Large ribosomal subunit protein mL67 n=1 Tax=Uncinula necator TaxID=52586 RepID=A0A0B1P0L0_UNCNE|nr:hypothetical protein EV44_g4739 [Erysiphe necator]
MRVLSTTEITRRAVQAINDIRNSTPVKKKSQKRPVIEHGQHIFIFSHIQKKMVAYSLKRALNNKDTLRHIPFNGKKTVPSALRKDHWLPFATIQFPKGCGPVGLSVFQKLREYRKRHEHEWGEEITKNPENGYFISKKKRGRKICDQVANSVADMAYVLGRLRQQEIVLENEEVPKIDRRIKKYSKRPRESASPYVSKPPPGGIGLVGEGKGLPVQVYWKDIKMAEYAETWSDNVEHGIIGLNNSYAIP